MDDTVAVVGDGAVGLSAVLAAARLGAERVIALSRHEDRQKLASAFDATDIVDRARRSGDRGSAWSSPTAVGADAVLECVGTGQSIATAFAVARPGAIVGYIGVPHGVEVPLQRMFFRNVGLHGGSAPVRAYIPELMDDVLAGRIRPRPRLRLRDRSRRDWRGLRGHARTPCDQVARARGEPLTWP